MNEKPGGELILYQTEDGRTRIESRLIDRSLWLSLNQIAELYQRDKSVVSRHLSNIFKEGELNPVSVVAKHATTAADGKTYQVDYYKLDAILAVGYRVKSPRGAQFRAWATAVLSEYLVKGFAMDDERLKQADRWDYFDEWLARIRDIRVSEKRFYQKVKDLYATAIDYEKDSDEAKLFFKKVQNKMLWAVTGQTAAELIASRSDPDRPNMGLTAWRGSVVRKGDVDTAKNYLKGEEIEDLNRIVTMYLDYAEEQAKRRKTVTMAQWAEKLDAFLQFNERELLTHAGKVRAEVAKQLAEERFETFDAKRRADAAREADAEDLAEIEKLTEELKAKNSE